MTIFFKLFFSQITSNFYCHDFCNGLDFIISNFVIQNLNYLIFLTLCHEFDSVIIVKLFCHMHNCNFLPNNYDLPCMISKSGRNRLSL